MNQLSLLEMPDRALTILLNLISIILTIAFANFTIRICRRVLFYVCAREIKIPNAECLEGLGGHVGVGGSGIASKPLILRLMSQVQSEGGLPLKFDFYYRNFV